MIKFEGSATRLMVNHEYTPEEGGGLIKEGRIDLVSFARPFIYNLVSLDFGNVAQAQIVASPSLIRFSHLGCDFPHQEEYTLRRR